MSREALRSGEPLWLTCGMSMQHMRSSGMMHDISTDAASDTVCVRYSLSAATSVMLWLRLRTRPALPRFR